MAQLRLSSHEILIEEGRYRNINRNDRKCLACHLNEIEVEFHFILICLLYASLRKQVIKKYYYVKPSVLKLIELLNINNQSLLNSLALFCQKGFKLRKDTLKVALQVLGRKFYKNTKKSSLYSQSLLIFIHKIQVVIQQQEKLENYYGPGRHRRESRSIFT